jgi:hypothetical protein
MPTTNMGGSVALADMGLGGEKRPGKYFPVSVHLLGKGLRVVRQLLVREPVAKRQIGPGLIRLLLTIFTA